MEHLEIILPIILLILSFMLKLMIDRSINVPIAIRSICELPVDMIFLSISFLIAFVISDNENRNEGLLYCFIFLIVATAVVFLWRRSVLLYEKQESKWWVGLLAINLLITITCLVISINSLSMKQNKDKLKNNKTGNITKKIN